MDNVSRLTKILAFQSGIATIYATVLFNIGFEKKSYVVSNDSYEPGAAKYAHLLAKCSRSLLQSKGRVDLSVR